MGKNRTQPLTLPRELGFSNAAVEFLEKCVGYGTAAFLFILPFLLHARLYDGSFVVKRAAIEIIVPLLLCCSALKLFFAKKAVAVKVTWLSLGVTAFLIWLWFSLSWSHHRFEAYVSAVRWTACILPFFLLAACKRREHWLRLWLGALIAASIGVSLLGICQTLFPYLNRPWPRKSIWPLGQLLLPFERWIGGAEQYLWSTDKFLWLLNKILWPFFKFLGQAAPPSSTFINRNFAMHFVNLTLPLSFVWILFAIRPASITLALLSLSLNCGYLFRSGSRAALIALGVMSICLAIALAVNSFIGFRLTQVKLTRLRGPTIAASLVLSILFVLYLIYLNWVASLLAVGAIISGFIIVAVINLALGALKRSFFAWFFVQFLIDFCIPAIILLSVCLFLPKEDSLIFILLLTFFSLTLLLLLNRYLRRKIFNPKAEPVAGLAIIVAAIIALAFFIPNNIDNRSPIEKFTALFSSSDSPKEAPGDQQGIAGAKAAPSPAPKAASAKPWAESLDLTKKSEDDVPLALALQRKAMEEPRLSIMANTFGMILDYPLRGVGTGNFRTYYPKYQGFWIRNEHLARGSRPEHAHDDYLQIFAELGIIGLGIFLLILLAGFWCTAYLLTNPKVNSRNRLLIIGVATAVLGLLVEMLFSFPLDRAMPPLLLFLFIGILDTFYRRVNHKAAEKIITLPAITFGVIGLLFAAATVFMAGENTRMLKYAALHQNMLEYEKLNKWAELIPDGIEAGRLLPEATRHLFYLGRAYAENNMLRQATTAMEKSLAADPYSAVSLTNYGVILGRRSLYEAASWELGKSVQLTPDFALGRVNYGFSLIKIGKIEAGLAQFRKAITLDPSDRYAYMHLGRTLKQIGKLDESLQVYLKAAEMCSNDPLALYEAGRELLARKRIKEAIPYYRKSIKHNPMDSRVCFELAQIYELVGKPDWARQLYEHILKNINPRDKRARLALYKLRARMGKAAAAKAAEAKAAGNKIGGK